MRRRVKLEGAELEEHKAKQRLKEAEEARIKAEKEKRLVSCFWWIRILDMEIRLIPVAYLDKHDLFTYSV